MLSFKVTFVDNAIAIASGQSSGRLRLVLGEEAGRSNPLVRSYRVSVTGARLVGAATAVSPPATASALNVDTAQNTAAAPGFGAIDLSLENLRANKQVHIAIDAIGQNGRPIEGEHSEQDISVAGTS